MNTETALKNMTVLPEAKVRKPDSRATAVMIKLLTEPEFAATATRLHKEHRANFLAFLLSDVELDEMEPDKLEKAFLGRFLVQFDSWEQARGSMIKAAVNVANERSEKDPAFKDHLKSHADHFLREMTGMVKSVQIASHVFVFGHPKARPTK